MAGARAGFGHAAWARLTVRGDGSTGKLKQLRANLDGEHSLVREDVRDLGYELDG